MPRGRALGLRGRLTAALTLTSGLTLLVAALVLLLPLDRQLRNDAVDNLAQTALAARPTFADLPARQIHAGSRPLAAAADALRVQTRSEVVVTDASGRVLVGTDADPRERFPAAAEAVRTQTVVKAFAGSGDESEAEAAVPVTRHGARFALVVRRPLGSALSAAAVVRRGLILAAAVGMVLAVGTGVLLARRLVRRLGSLRDTALRVADLGPAAEVLPDARRDEIGDLTRAFATMQAQLREQEQARRTFVSTASHELRTPLASLRLMLGLLAEDLEAGAPDLDDARAQVIRAQRQSDRLGQLAANLLDLSRLDAGLPVRRELLALGDTSRAVVAEFAPRSETAGVPIELAVPDSCWAVADPGSVAQVVRILLDNALRFSPPGSPVEVEVATRDGTPAVTVRDRGPGVEPEDRERIFERFERGRDTSGESGFGLGLAIGRELARRMDGELRLDPSEAGAAFVLTLPAAPAGALEPTRP